MGKPKSIRQRAMASAMHRHSKPVENRAIWAPLWQDRGFAVPRFINPIVYVNFKPVRVKQSDTY